MPRKKPQEPAGAPKAEDKREAPQPAPESVKSASEPMELTPEEIQRLDAVWERVRAYRPPMFIELVDTGAHEEGDSKKLNQLGAVLREAGDKVLEILGYERGEGRDLGRYGMVYDSKDELPPEMRVAYDCICKAHGDALQQWQEEAVAWRADQAVMDEAWAIGGERVMARAEAEAKAKAKAKPKRPRRPRKGQEPKSK